MEWIAIAAGIVSGLVSGFGAAWIGRPAAAAAAEEAKKRTEERRDIVRAGRELVQEAHANDWSPSNVAHDRRYVLIRRHLSPDVQAAYALDLSAPTPSFSMRPALAVPKNSHEALQADVERLDAEWNLS